MKKNSALKIEDSSDENTSPKMASNMMMNWLSKKGKNDDKSTDKSKVADGNKSQALTKSKKLDTRCLNLEEDDDDDEIVWKKTSKTGSTTSKTESTTSKTGSTSSSKDKTKTPPKPKPTEAAPAKKSVKESPAAKATTTPKGKTQEKTVTTPKSTEEPEQKKKPANKFYAAYMRREGPKNPGSKPIPIGKKDCLSGLKFLVTGVLDSLERDDCKRIVEKYGGSMVSTVTKKLDYLILGSDGGQSKIEKAKEQNVKMLNEDEFLELIHKKSGITNPKREDFEQAEMDENVDFEMKDELTESFDLGKDTPATKPKEEKKETPKKTTPKKTPIKTEPKTTPSKTKDIKIEIKSEKSTQPAIVEKKEPKEPVPITQLWVDKYKPTAMARIIGQGGDRSNANKLLNWLKNWNKNHSGGDAKGAKKTWNDDTGSSFKAALLSGPPGIGKTTTAQLVCKEAGYTFVELNASDSRSKKLLDSVIGESVENCSIDSYFRGNKHRSDELNQDKHCIIMDEVDGMAGNEDRGGIQQLILTLKSSKIPIICICNDRQHVKIRSLANYCFDLRFTKPRMEQVRSALMSICFKEGVKTSADVLDQIITGCNYDIRQCLHNLSIWSSNNKVMTASQSTQKDIEKAMKDIRMNPFEACKQTFVDDPNAKKPKSVMDRMDLFFTDYSLMPLLIQENYLSVTPSNLKGNTKKDKEINHFQLLTESIQSICYSDRIGKLIHTNNNWSMLPTQALFAVALPGEKMHGHIGLPAFPSWFGKHSKEGRVDRLLQELQKHMRIHISANKIGVGMEYLSVLKDMLSKPLIKRGSDGIETVLKIMEEYSLTREDFDTILELSTWPGQKDPNTLIDSKVKAAFTRAYNKESHKNPFTLVNVKKLKSSKANEEELLGEEGGAAEEEEEDEDDVNSDAMIKVKAVKKKSETAATTKTTGVKRSAAKASNDADQPSKPKASKRKKT